MNFMPPYIFYWGGEEKSENHFYMDSFVFASLHLWPYYLDRKKISS